MWVGGGNVDMWGNKETRNYTWNECLCNFSRESRNLFCFAKFKQVKFHILYPHHYIIVEQVHWIYTTLHRTEANKAGCVTSFSKSEIMRYFVQDSSQTWYSMTPDSFRSQLLLSKVHLHATGGLMVAMRQGNLEACCTTQRYRQQLRCLTGQWNWK